MEDHPVNTDSDEPLTFLKFPNSAIAQFQYIKIQPKTIDITTRLWGINPTYSIVYSPEPHAEVYGFRLNLNISKLVYYIQVAYTSCMLELPLVLHRIDKFEEEIKRR